LIGKNGGGSFYFAALDAASDVFDICISVPCFFREAVLVVPLPVGQRRGLRMMEALLAHRDGGCFDCVDNGRALGWDFDVSLVTTEEDAYRY
jgi:hypothetical protein